MEKNKMRKWNKQTRVKKNEKQKTINERQQKNRM